MHTIIRIGLAAVGILICSGLAGAQDGPEKALPLDGDVFSVEGRTAFVLRPDAVADGDVMPWVWYAPTLPKLPGDAETWMFEAFLAQGIAIAGIDVGESYGSPAGIALYDALYRELTANRGFARRPCLLARSRGGLMLYGWAATHPDAVACIAGIYPVCNLESYPGLARAAAAFGSTEAELAATLGDHNPIERLAPIAAAGVPIFHLHGDGDRVVPLADNSAIVARRYARLGGTMVLETVAGRGHDMWRGWFESQELVDFVVTHGRATTGTTRGVVEALAGRRPADATVLLDEAGSRFVPENPDGASEWAFADGVLTASSRWDSVVTPEPYRDFCLHVEFCVNESDRDNPEGRGNSGVYIQQRYELQILDSHGVSAEEFGHNGCGSLYRLKKPDQLVARPPGAWQSYDVVFRAARFEGDAKVENARITAFHNGVLIHDDVEVPRKTGAGKAEGPEPRPIKLQGHANPVRFRNAWIQRLDLTR